MNGLFQFVVVIFFLFEAGHQAVNPFEQRLVCDFLINIEMFANLAEIGFSGKYLEYKLISCSVQMMECLRREIGFEKDSHKEVLFHLFLFNVGLLEVVHRHPSIAPDITISLY